MHTDKFQPLSLVNAMKGYMATVTEQILNLKEQQNNSVEIDPLNLERLQGVVMGLAWAISEILGQATANDRYIS